MGKNQKSRSDYFNACRAKRNVTDYDRVGEISETELKEILEEALLFRLDVIAWLQDNYSEFI